MVDFEWWRAYRPIRPVDCPMGKPTLLRGLRRGHFVDVVADVPWAFATRSPKGITSRSPESKYPTMSLAEIEALPVKDVAAKHSRLWFWITGPFLAIGAHIPIMRGWGFEPVAMAFVWVKPGQNHFGYRRWVGQDLFPIGNGYTTRQNAEYVILGARGNPPERLSKSVRQVLVEPAREHSRKPEQFYESVERYSAGPYLELFARRRRRGWICRGNEVEKFK